MNLIQAYKVNLLRFHNFIFLFFLDEDLSSDDEDYVYFNDSWNPSVNYDTYRSRMARMLAKPESSDEDE